jgi:lysozyme family protein
VWHLCGIPAAQQLTSQVVLQLLEAAVQQGSGSSIRALCELPAAKQLSKQAVAGLLQTAHQVDGRLNSTCAAALRKLPGACCRN